MLSAMVAGATNGHSAKQSASKGVQNKDDVCATVIPCEAES